MPAGFFRFGQALMLAALLAASGGHWAVLQSVAWTTMIVDYSRTSRISDAVAKTFDGEHPCPLCKTIAKGRASENRPDSQAAVSKVDFFFRQAGAFIPPSLSSWRCVASSDIADERAHLPALQPPRVFFTA